MAHIYYKALLKTNTRKVELRSMFEKKIISVITTLFAFGLTGPNLVGIVQDNAWGQLP